MYYGRITNFAIAVHLLLLISYSDFPRPRCKTEWDLGTRLSLNLSLSQKISQLQLFLESLLWTRQSAIEMYHVTSLYHGSKLLDLGHRFVPECDHAQESSYTRWIFFPFFCHICRITVCWDPDILLPWQRDVTASSPFKSFFFSFVCSNSPRSLCES